MTRRALGYAADPFIGMDLAAWVRHAGHISAIRSTWLWLLNDYLPGSGLALADAPDLEQRRG